MTNREKYFLKRDEFDTMKAIEKNLPPDMCVIEIVSGEHPDPKHGLCWYGGWDGKCDKCQQKWLNQEADQPRPKWQDAMMKNFLRKE